MSKSKEQRTMAATTVPAGSTLSELVRVNTTALPANVLQQECELIQEVLIECQVVGGHSAMIRNDCRQRRDLLAACEPAPVREPRLCTRDKEPFTFHLKLVSPCLRHCRELDEALSWLHYDFPVMHWHPTRLTNVIESVFAPSRPHTHQPRDNNRLDMVTGMVCKLAVAAQRNWHWPHGFDGIAQERTSDLIDQTQRLVVSP